MNDSNSDLRITILAENVPVVKLAGQADFHSRYAIQEAFENLVEKGCTAMRADLGELLYMDSSALSMLVKCATRASEAGVSIELIAASRQVSRVINLCGAAMFFKSQTYQVPVCSEGGLRQPAESFWHVSDFSLPARPEAAGVARRRIGEVVKTLPISLSESQDILVAVGEALANAIRHGCKYDAEKRISVKCVAGPRRLAIDIVDPGLGFDPEAVAEPSPNSLLEGGMGIFMMRSLMDEISFHFDGQTTTRLVKFIEAPVVKQSPLEPLEMLGV